MDAVDEVLLNTLLSVGCDIPSDATSVDQLSPSDVLEALVVCLWAIEPKFRETVTSSKMPVNPGARFRLAGAVADAIKSLGCTQQLGYQSVLYGSANEHRHLLLFLADRLPKVQQLDGKKEGETPLQAVFTAAGGKIRDQLAVPWTPWRRASAWPQNTTDSADVLSRASTLEFCSFLDHQSNIHWRHVPAVVLARCQLLRCGLDLAKIDDLATELRREFTKNEKTGAGVKKPALAPKPKIGAKSLSGTDRVFDEVKDENVETTVEDTETATAAHERHQRAKLDELRAEIDRLRQEAQQVRSEGASLQRQVAARRDEWQTVGVRLAALLQQPHSESVHKLRAMVSGGEERMQRLEQQLSRGRSELTAELHEATQRQLQSQQTEAGRLSERRDRAAATCSKMSTELQLKQNFVAHLESERAKMVRGAARSAYTERIMEMINSVNKQRQLIDKTVADNLLIQKEIKMLTGKLERAFIAAHMEFKESAVGGDSALSKSVSLLDRIHDTCALSLQAIQATGNVQRNIEELHNQVETEGQKSAAVNLDKLVNDYCEIKMENESMQMRLRQAAETCSRCAPKAD